jgi:hypothetical protein
VPLAKTDGVSEQAEAALGSTVVAGAGAGVLIAIVAGVLIYVVWRRRSREKSGVDLEEELAPVIETSEEFDEYVAQLDYENPLATELFQTALNE